MMPRRKKKWMLLHSVNGVFIVVERQWYDYAEIAKLRGNQKQWWIAAQSDDQVMLQKIAGLTGRYLKMEVNHETECTLAYHEQLVTRRV
jgi:hypothetical protein